MAVIGTGGQDVFENNVPGPASDIGYNTGDTLQGEGDDDTYFIEAGDSTTIVDEVTNGGGNDLVSSASNFDLSTRGLGVERLELTGAATTGTGNDLANIITGLNAAVSYTLNGGLGADTLTGNALADILDGGTGDDTMIGGAGNDTYYVDSAADVVTENGAEGTDLIFSTVNIAALAANVENLTLSGAATQGTGNALGNVIVGTNNAIQYTLDGGDGDDTITGADGADTLIGGLGADTLNGGIGADLLQGGDGADVLNGGADSDHLEGGAGNDTLNGGDGDDILNGGTGDDTMIGGAGNDTYYVDSANDVVTEGAAAGTDLIFSTVNIAALAANVENLTLTGASANEATGNALANTIIGNEATETYTFNGGDGNDILTGNALADILNGGAGVDTLTGGLGADTLNGGTGADTMNGGGGDDTYYVDDAGDVVIDSAGTDTVVTSILGWTHADIENVIYTGTVEGTDADETFTATDGVDTTMEGGKGDDTYVILNAGDAVVEKANGGKADVVQSAAVSIDLSDAAFKNVENATLTGAANLDLTGSNKNNILTGNDGQNVLDGGKGKDTLIGGLGNDTYIVNDKRTVVDETTGGGGAADRVVASVNYTLVAGVENLDLAAGTKNLKGTGNALDNAITGNDGNNVIDGGVGADAMTGGLGNDTYFVDNAGDTVVEANGEGKDVIVTSVNFTASANVEVLVANKDVVAGLQLTGNALDNTIVGSDFNDVLNGGAGADVLKGGKGDDTYVIDNVGDKIQDTSGVDEVRTSIDMEKLANGLEDLILFNGAVIGGGNNKANDISVDAGNGATVTLYGYGGDDIITGSAQADSIFGGKGDDQLTGNGGADIFFLEKNGGVDTITDWNTGGNTLDISDLLAKYDNLTDDLADFVSFENVAGDVVVSVDIHGRGNFKEVAVLTGAAGDYADLTALNADLQY